MAGLKLPTFKTMSLENELVEYLKPSVVSIPLVVGADSNVKALKNIGDKVLKGEIIGIREGALELPIISSISGTITSIDVIDKVTHIVIENDFNETQYNETTRDIMNISKEEFIKIIKDCGISGMGGSGFPTYVKYNISDKIDTLLVNAIECEPYITADYTIIKKHAKEIIEGINAILKINNIDNAIIAVKEHNKELFEEFKKYSNDKIIFKTTKNIYPAGWERQLIKETTGKTYKILTKEAGIIVNNVSTIYAIYNALKYNLPATERIVTFTGNLDKPTNVLVKIGTSSKEVINYLGNTLSDEDIIISGGPMMGNHVLNDIYINPSINNILVINNYKEDMPTECLRCGKCVNVCPAGLCPVLIKDNFRNKEKLSYLEPSKCIECGLCSYICPAKINVREKVKLAKIVMKGVK